ncbi:MAG: efflux RND transporter permease subunit [Planctomycetes bacterium]|nr:efflux RND transporter permease subunit [Planctomycetota bacterium]
MSESRGWADLFHRRPRLLFLVVSLLLVAGLSAFAVLPRAEDPSLKGRAARVLTRLPGGTPERVEALVTEKLERELREVPEIRLLRSVSRRGVSLITIELEDQVEAPAEIWTTVRKALDDAKGSLPPDASEPDFEPLEIRAFTLLVSLTWTGEGPPPRGPLRRLGETLRDRLRRVAGTEDVDLAGDVPEEISVEISPTTLSSLGLSASDVAAAIVGRDAKVGAGRVEGFEELQLEVSDLESGAGLAAVPLRVGSDGRLVRLGDVAQITRGVLDPADELAFIGGRPAVVVAVRMRDGERIDRWSSAAREALDEFRAELPRGVALETVFDQSRYTEARLRRLFENLGLGIVLVMGVLLVIMGWRSALLVGLALPLASLGVFAGMRLLEVPLHQMSVTGLIIALGLLIDNAIVVVDEVEARLSRGAPAGEAIPQAVRHLAVPLLSSTLTTALAFMPMVLMPGPAGEFVGAIGLSVILALASSLFLALTVIPALRGLLERAEAASPPPAWWRTGVRLPSLAAAYERALGALLARPLLAAFVVAIPALLGFGAATQLDEQFFPPSDRDQLQVEIRLPAQSSLETTSAVTSRARALMTAQDGVREVHWFVGKTAPKFYYNMLRGHDGSAYYAQGLIQLESSEDSARVVRELQATLDRELTSAQCVVKRLEQGPPFEAPIELHLSGPDLGVLRAKGEEARRILASVPDVVVARTSLVGGQPQLRYEIDEGEAARIGLSRRGIARELEASLSGTPAGSLLEDTEQVPIRVRVTRAAREKRTGVESMGVFAPGRGTGDYRRAAPVMALGTLSLVPHAARITRRMGERSNSVQGFVQAGVLPSRALAAFQAALAKEEFTLPPGYRMAFGGESGERDRAVRNLLASAGILLVLMIATLVLSFDSFRMAAIVGAVGVLSVGLALLALWLTQTPFGFMAIVGAMGLVGIAINDAIVVLAALRDDPGAMGGDLEATRRVVLHSTRHVVATTLTTVAGFVPLLLTGGTFWRPLSISIAGGVAGATLLALTFVPALFLVLRQRACGATQLP